jgi:hypothetical protein
MALQMERKFASESPMIAFSKNQCCGTKFIPITQRQWQSAQKRHALRAGDVFPSTVTSDIQSEPREPRQRLQWNIVRCPTLRADVSFAPFDNQRFLVKGHRRAENFTSLTIFYSELNQIRFRFGQDDTGIRQ